MIAANHPRLVVAIDARHAETNRARLDRAAAERVGDHVAQRALDAHFPGCVEVRAGAAAFGDDRAVLVSDEAHRLRAAGIDPDHVHGRV